MIGTPVFAATALLAFVVSYIALCAFRPAAKVLRLVDVAGTLKPEQGEVPLVGGLAILCGYLIGLLIYPSFFEANSLFVLASVLLVSLGAADDRFLLGARLRLAVQILVSLIAVFGAGMVVGTIGAPFFTGVIEMGWLAIPFSILVFVGGINAWNMIDGIDGLASVMAFIGLSCMLAVSGSATPSLQASLLAMLCGIGAFSVFNLPVHGLRRHRTFLGDAGSMFLGFAIVWHALALSQGETAVMSPITALWFVALPVYDVITTTLRRILKGRSPLFGDREHLHHLLQDRGLSIRQTLVVLSALAWLGGAIGLSSHFAGISDGTMFALFVLLGAIYFFSVRRLTNAVLRNNSIQHRQESPELL
jgi:UDP-GlcNAc:undecaprenyl-phosphate GlcNAc-1-phosphate transferase